MSTKTYIHTSLLYGFSLSDAKRITGGQNRIIRVRAKLSNVPAKVPYSFFIPRFLGVFNFVCLSLIYLIAMRAGVNWDLMSNKKVDKKYFVTFQGKKERNKVLPLSIKFF